MNRLANSLAWLLYFFPVVFGYAYTATLAVLSILSLATQASPAVRTMFVVGLCGYAIFGVINFCVMAVFGYRNCCIGLNRFGPHLGHSKLQLAIDAFWSPLWPLNWHSVTRNLLTWGIDWTGVVIEPTAYWVSSIRKGHRLDTVNLTADTQETTYF